jgi:saccharopine dehydrogenase-like NADP-dependent oxidoreductase
MRKVLIVGAGAQGGPCAQILSRDDEVSEIVLGDIDLQLARKVEEKIKSDKVTAVKLDAGKVEEVEKAAEGADAVINLTLTVYDMNIMEAALRSGAHYVDTSFGEPTMLDIRARDNILAQIIEGRPLSFDEEYRDAGLTAVLGCGFSPGTTNVTARYLCDKLEQVEKIRVFIGKKSFKPHGEMVSPWTSTWSPFRTLWGYAVEPTIFEGGQYKKYPTFARPKEYPFPDPVGNILVTLHQHQEPITLPHFIGKGIKYCDFNYPIDPIAGAFVKMGFASPDEIEVKGLKVVPRDVLLSLTSPPANLFLNENEESAKQLRSANLYVVEVEGTKKGKDVQFKASSPSTFFRTVEEKIKVFRKMGTTIIGVALPAIVGAKMCLKGDVDKGVISAECLDPKTFFKMLKEMGAPLKLQEVQTRKILFT